MADSRSSDAPALAPQSALDVALLAAYGLWNVAIAAVLVAGAGAAERPDGAPPFYAEMLVIYWREVLAGTALAVGLLALVWRQAGRTRPDGLSEDGRALRLILAGAMTSVLAASAYLAPMLFERLMIAALGGVIVLVATGAGRAIFEWILPGMEPRGLKLSCSLSLGLGAFGLLGLLLVSTGLCERRIVLGLVILGAAVFRKACRSTAGDVGAFLRGPRRGFDFAVAAFVVLFGVFAGGAMLSAMLPPWDYDELEYHLALPREYLATGTGRVLDHSVFSGFPLSSEMLSALAMAILPGRIEGAYLAKVLVALTGLAGAAPVYALAARWGGARAGAAGAAAYLWSAGSGLLFARAYAEPMLVLHGATAVACAVYSTDLTGRSRTRILVLTGLAAALAAGAKYTACVLVLLPVVGIAAASGVARGRRAMGAVRDSAILVAAFAAGILPWIARDLWWTGDPFYPLLAARFGLAGWSEERCARFLAAHAVKPVSMSAAWRSFTAVFGPPVSIGDAREAHVTSVLVAAFAPFAAVYSIRARRMGALWWALGAYLVAWFALTHRLPRFAFPAVALASALAGVGYAEISRGPRERVVAGGLAAWALISAAGVIGSFPGVIAYDVATGAREERALMTQVLHEELTAFDAVSLLPEGGRVLLVGEARTFFLPPGRCVYRTVFDGCEIAEVLRSSRGAAAAAEELAARGYSHVYVNWKEFQRLETTYAFSLHGLRHGGYADFDAGEWAALKSLIRGRMEPVWSAGERAGPSLALGTPQEAEWNAAWSATWGRRIPAPPWAERSFTLYRLKRPGGGEDGR